MSDKIWRCQNMETGNIVWLPYQPVGPWDCVAFITKDEYDQLRAELAALKAGQGEADSWHEFVGSAEKLLNEEQERLSDEGYLMDSDDCIKVLREAAPPAQAEPVASLEVTGESLIVGRPGFFPPASADAVSVPRELVRFLLGETDLNGYSFGDMHQVRVGKFWWRTELRALLAQSQGVKP